MRHSSRRLQPALSRLLPVALFLVSACGEPAKPQPPSPPAGPRYEAPQNVLLITIDTLRADHLGCYGYERETSPRIDQLAAEGVRFERSYSVAGTTLPSHLSIMTGLLPHQHGYVANKGAIKGPFQPSEGRHTAAEFFSQAGYETAAFVSGTTVKKTTGIQAGFKTFDQPHTLNRVGALTVDAASHWLDLFAKYGKTKKNGEARHFFLWVHLWDPHEPNTPPAPYDSLFGRGDGVAERLLAERHVDLQRLLEAFDQVELARMFFPELVRPLKTGEEVDFPTLTEAHLLRLYDLYDGDVRYADEQVGRLIDLLESTKLAQNTIVALVADHGQALGQHDWLEHGRIQLEETHVPMILRFPGELIDQPQVLDGVISTIDLMPSIVARLDLSTGPQLLAQAEGQDLFSGHFERPFAFSHRSERERDNWEPGRKFGLTLSDWKYYHLEEGQDQLFDLRNDPGEWQDVAAKYPERVEKMQQVVNRILATRPASGPLSGTLDSEEAAAYEAELKALGYLGD